MPEPSSEPAAASPSTGRAVVNLRAVTCPRCLRALPPGAINRGLTACPNCRQRAATWVFPAMFRHVAGQAPERLDELAEDASCFFHETNRAVVPCDGCGRFLCALCDVELHGRHLCPSCLAHPAEQATAVALPRRRVMYREMAGGLAILGLVTLMLCGVGGLVGIAAIVFGILALRQPLAPHQSPVRERVGAGVAIVGGALEFLALIGMGLAFLFA